MNSRPTSKRSLVALVPSGLVLMLLTGCTVTLNQDDPIRPPQSQELSYAQFKDIPVPLGFNLEENPISSIRHPGSFSFQTASFRSGRFLYSGRGPIDALVSFFDDQMQNPYHGWSAVSREIGPSSADLVFDKGDSRSTIELFKKGQRTYVLIEVRPRNES